MRIVFYILVIVLIVSCKSQDKIVSLVKFSGKYGFIDTKGNWYIKPIFDSLGIFYNGFADCYSNGKVGKIDFKGRQIIDYRFDFIGAIDDNRALVIKNDSINYIGLSGKLISKKYFFDGYDFSSGLAPVNINESGKWGYIDSNCNFVIDTLFDYAEEFKNGKAEVDIGDCEYLIDIKGNIIDTVRNLKTLKKFSIIGNSNYNTLGLLNNVGDTIMKGKYKSFGYIQEDKFWFNNGQYYGLSDTTGKNLCQSQYEYLSYFADNGLALAKLNGKFGFISKNCAVIIEFQFQDAQGFKYGLAAVKQNNKWGFINRKGKFIIKPKYENVGYQFRPINAKFESMYSFEKN